MYKNISLIKTGTERRKKKWLDRKCIDSVKKKHKSWKSYIHTRSRQNFDFNLKLEISVQKL